VNDLIVSFVVVVGVVVRVWLFGGLLRIVLSRCLQKCIMNMLGLKHDVLVSIWLSIR